ncbi:hypothetical protein GCM10025857_22670 [Alicyclobacillus contaminans]|nr:hypothetical protein GCM10025857_22670 [Alicyclobacillus contaminans]
MAYTIGIDFGTLSGRVMLLNVEDGQEVAVDVVPYEHGVLDRELPTGEPLPPDWALQHPKDYLEVIYRGIPSVISKGAWIRMRWWALVLTSPPARSYRRSGTVLRFVWLRAGSTARTRGQNCGSIIRHSPWQTA